MPRSRRGFTLIELLVVIAVIAVLIGVLLPALGSAREAGRSAVCLSNLRQAYIACRAYADEHRGVGPAIGVPYAALPNWALVVQASSGRDGSTPGELYSTTSVLVCPTIRSFYARDMTRTYAMNATGHACLPGDPDTYDPDVCSGGAARPSPAYIRFDLVQFPSAAVLLVDSAVAPVQGQPPPSTRTASVLDFRQPAHVAERLGKFHGPRAAINPERVGESTRNFNAALIDGSARTFRDPAPEWTTPLP